MAFVLCVGCGKGDTERIRSKKNMDMAWNDII